MLQEIEADEGEVEYEEMIERSPCGLQALTTGTLKENRPRAQHYSWVEEQSTGSASESASGSRKTDAVLKSSASFPSGFESSLVRD